MKISELLKQDKVTLSFEVFPPKTSSSYESVARATQEIAALRPDFMSVTYGAGGGTSEHTVNIAADLKKKYDVTVLTHLTCVSSTREHVAKMVQKYKENGIENILALRGDIPEGGAPHSDYHYAAELVRDIKSQGDFCIGGACYPESHVEAANTKAKQQAFGVAYAKGILDTLGIKYDTTTAKPAEPTKPQDAEVQAAIEKIQTKAGLEEKTMEYLLAYEYGEELVKKLAKAMEK